MTELLVFLSYLVSSSAVYVAASAFHCPYTDVQKKKNSLHVEWHFGTEFDRLVHNIMEFSIILLSFSCYQTWQVRPPSRLEGGLLYQVTPEQFLFID